TDISKAADYQNIISIRVRILKEQDKQRAAHLAALNSLKKHLGQYITALTDSSSQAQQHHANAVELKKRVGRGHIKSSKIPDGITKALNRDLIIRLETETAKNLNYQIYIRQEIQRLSKVDKTLGDTDKLLNEIRVLAGRRLDTLRELDKLEQDFSLTKNNLSETERKTVEQSALRKLKSENTFPELFIGFIRSAEVKNLTGLLQSYYIELSELENKQENLKKQNQKSDRLIKIANDEKSAVIKLIPVLQKQVIILEREKEEKWIKVRVQVMPGKKAEILGNYKAKTGRSVSASKMKKDDLNKRFIDNVIEALFDKHVKIVAANKRINLFKQRLASDGIDSEIAGFQDRLGDLNARDGAIKRRVKYISGHLPDELINLPPEEKPKTKIDKILFLKGEIGVLRLDRYNLGREFLTVVMIKLSVVMIAVIFFSWLIGRLTSRMIKLSDEKSNAENNQYFPFIIMIKKVSRFLVWSIAFIIILDVVGFNVGTFIAGLGIGGFAIAFAVKGVLADVFGGLSIMITKPFRVGEIIDFDDSMCLVNEIGIRYTALMNYETNYKYTVPNSMLAESKIINISSHPGHMIFTKIYLSTHNNVEKIKLALKLLNKIVEDHQKTKFNWVGYKYFDDYSFVIKLHYDVLKFGERIGVETEINCDIVRFFQKNNIEFTPIPGEGGMLISNS
ncbi:mechanosensitive ion channel, partial [Desulfobacterales bacterium HSG17]|nr:mechanosensitive ion channel [Desulfobacterales bacterium HSG17]